jgi:hypothetical protein
VRAAWVEHERTTSQQRTEVVASAIDRVSGLQHHTRLTDPPDLKSPAELHAGWTVTTLPCVINTLHPAGS